MRLSTFSWSLLALAVLFCPAQLLAQTPSDDGGDKAAAEETADSSQNDGKNQKSDDDLNEDGTYNKTIRWATASEVDNFGYDIFRGLSEDGPFERLTEDPIAGAGTTDEPSYYTYVDEGLDPSVDYYYYIESISMHGVRERFTPIQKVAARNPAEESQD